MAKSKPRRVKRSARTGRPRPARKAKTRKMRSRTVKSRKAKSRKAKSRKVTSRKAPRRSTSQRTVRRSARKPAAPKRIAPAPTTLARARRVLSDAERLETSRLDAQLASSVRAGRNDLRHRLAEHTESDPSLTAGDLDAKWEDAYAVGDEAPGGDNPTPDQDRVDDIGRALGVEYQEGEELKSSDKIAKRDQHRWELDPASSEDWPHGRTEEE